MEKMSKYDEFIQPFLDGELSREELDWFSKELQSNAVLAEDIKLYREVDNAIREQDVMELTRPTRCDPQFDWGSY